ncbi:MAG: NAD-dependent epimerase/dehydratase family protein [Gemmatimonadaceae bacterium]|nr:NAD-dependent epimerase/dehydratase family protein [Gemmatimonadaceae bacterium]
MSSPSHPAPRRALVLGAGWLGGALAQTLAADGVVVTTVRRSAHEAPPGGQALALDLRALADPAVPLPAALHAHDVVIALVAPDRRRGDDHGATYPTSARAAARIARAIGARALCWISSTGVYGYTSGEFVDEDTPLAATDPSQQALIAAEQLVRDADGDGLIAGVLRVAGLYGPDRDPLPRYRDVTALAARWEHWTNLAWRDDVIGAIRVWLAHALGPNATATPRVLNVADGTPLQVRTCAAIVAEAEGRTLDLASIVSHRATADVAAAPTPMRSNQRILVHRLRALGWRPQTPSLRAGLLRLGYARVTVDTPPYGPQTAQIRTFLQRLAALDAEAHARVLAAWTAHRERASFRRAERMLGEVMARADRESARDAAAGPLLQMMRRPVAESTDTVASEDPLATLDPLAEPALATLLALLVRDLLPADTFAELVVPLAALVDGPDAATG